MTWLGWLQFVAVKAFIRLIVLVTIGPSGLERFNAEAKRIDALTDAERCAEMLAHMSELSGKP